MPRLVKLLLTTGRTSELEDHPSVREATIKVVRQNPDATRRSDTAGAVSADGVVISPAKPGPRGVQDALTLVDATDAAKPHGTGKRRRRRITPKEPRSRSRKAEGMGVDADADAGADTSASCADADADEGAGVSASCAEEDADADADGSSPDRIEYDSDRLRGLFDPNDEVHACSLTGFLPVHVAVANSLADMFDFLTVGIGNTHDTAKLRASSSVLTTCRRVAGLAWLRPERRRWRFESFFTPRRTHVPPPPLPFFMTAHSPVPFTGHVARV